MPDAATLNNSTATLAFTVPAGAQNHWDWNARASASGPPAQSPAVPSTLEDAKTYILNPAAWDFYP